MGLKNTCFCPFLHVILATQVIDKNVSYQVQHPVSNCMCDCHYAMRNPNFDPFCMYCIGRRRKSQPSKQTGEEPEPKLAPTASLENTIKLLNTHEAPEHT